MGVTVIVALGALLIRTGYALYAAATVRAKNAAATITRHLLDTCVTLLAFWALGWAIASSSGNFLWLRPGALFGVSADSVLPASLLAAVLLPTGILPGVLAERARLWPGIIASAILAALIVPIALLWTRGWLANIAFSEGAGAATLHLTGAVAAAVGAMFVGPRSGKFNRDGSSTAIPVHSLPLAGAAVFLQLVGFTIFVGLSGPGWQVELASAVATNVLLAAAAAGLVAALLSQYRYHKPDCHLITAAILGALVAISAGAGSVLSPFAVLIGAVAGLLVPLAALTFDLRLRLDDPTAGVAIHGVGALIGLLLTPILARGLTLTERLKHLGGNLLGTFAIAALTAALSYATWTLLKRTMKLRASEAEEFDGLDLAEHDLAAYPDFQQTMIKSYHLREV